MEAEDCVPLVEVSRGDIVESVHYGAFCIVDSRGKEIASEGNPELMTYPRSSMKPFQALPFIERGGDSAFNFTGQEIAIMCASHAGTDLHTAVIKKMHEKIGISEADLACGASWPHDAQTRLMMKMAGEKPSPLRHNCSGKHTGMLAHACLRGLDKENYLDPNHPVQVTIRQVLGEMVGLAPDEMPLGIDGCSAPVYGIPLRAMAQAVASLADPIKLDPVRREACNKITMAMMNNPVMIAGEGMFDTELMTRLSGKVFSKGGAEGYQIVGIMPGVIEEGSPGIGIAVKIADGDHKSRARSCVILTILSTLGVLSEKDLEQMTAFGCIPIYNARQLVVGQVRPGFSLD
ncbi:MAG: asparaginase [Chloroflexota bacterium]|nr:asparaginase [Chloroflexota bacterium]